MASKLFVFALMDVQAQAFARPFFSPAKGVALRELGEEVNRDDGKNLLFTHPQDFRLFELGEWDERTGLFQCHAQPLLVVDLSSLKVGKV